MSGDEKYELTLSFDELTLIYKSLLAAKSLGVLSQDGGFVDDTIQVVELAFRARSASRSSARSRCAEIAARTRTACWSEVHQMIARVNQVETRFSSVVHLALLAFSA